MNEQSLPSIVVDQEYVHGKAEKSADVTHKMIGVKSMIAEAMQGLDPEDHENAEYLNGALKALAEGNIAQATAYIAVASGLERSVRGQIMSEIKALESVKNAAPSSAN